MLRTLLMILAIGAASGCDQAPSADDQLKLEMKQARAEAAATQERLVTAAVQSVNAVPLIPDEIRWDYRFHAQDHFSSLEGKNVVVEVEVRDAVRRPDGLVVSGEVLSFYPLLLWVRLHGIPEATIHQIAPHDSVICIGAPYVTAPAGPYLEMRPLNEDEIQVETSAIPLIVDVNCTHAWHKK